MTKIKVVQLKKGREYEYVELHIPLPVSLKGTWTINRIWNYGKDVRITRHKLQACLRKKI